jgi:hypothetical protein
MRSKRVQRLETMDMRYLSRIPKKIPSGRVIAHNNILHGPNWPTGPNGFRAWTWTASKEHADFVLCPCGWAGLEHYAHKDAVEYFREDPERYQRRVKELETEHSCFEDA